MRKCFEVEVEGDLQNHSRTWIHYDNTISLGFQEPQFHFSIALFKSLQFSFFTIRSVQTHLKTFKSGKKVSNLDQRTEFRSSYEIR